MPWVWEDELEKATEEQVGELTVSRLPSGKYVIWKKSDQSVLPLIRREEEEREEEEESSITRLKDGRYIIWQEPKQPTPTSLASLFEPSPEVKAKGTIWQTLKKRFLEPTPTPTEEEVTEWFTTVSPFHRVLAKAGRKVRPQVPTEEELRVIGEEMFGIGKPYQPQREEIRAVKPEEKKLYEELEKQPEYWQLLGLPADKEEREKYLNQQAFLKRIKPTVDKMLKDIYGEEELEKKRKAKKREEFLARMGLGAAFGLWRYPLEMALYEGYFQLKNALVSRFKKEKYSPFEVRMLNELLPKDTPTFIKFGAGLLEAVGDISLMHGLTNLTKKGLLKSTLNTIEKKLKATGMTPEEIRKDWEKFMVKNYVKQGKSLSEAMELAKQGIPLKQFIKGTSLEREANRYLKALTTKVKSQRLALPYLTPEAQPPALFIPQTEVSLPAPTPTLPQQPPTIPSPAPSKISDTEFVKTKLQPVLEKPADELAPKDQQILAEAQERGLIETPKVTVGGKKVALTEGKELVLTDKFFKIAEKEKLPFLGYKAEEKAIKKPYEGVIPGTDKWMEIWRKHPELQGEMLEYKKQWRAKLEKAKKEEVKPKKEEVKPEEEIVKLAQQYVEVTKEPSPTNLIFQKQAEIWEKLKKHFENIVKQKAPELPKEGRESIATVLSSEALFENPKFAFRNIEGHIERYKRQLEEEKKKIEWEKEIEKRKKEIKEIEKEAEAKVKSKEEAIKEQNRKVALSNKYYIATGEWKLQPLGSKKVYPFKYGNIELFAYSPKKGKWQIIERATGGLITEGRTKKDALEKALAQFRPLSSKDLEEIRQKALKKLGIEEIFKKKEIKSLKVEKPPVKEKIIPSVAKQEVSRNQLKPGDIVEVKFKGKVYKGKIKALNPQEWAKLTGGRYIAVSFEPSPDSAKPTKSSQLGYGLPWTSRAKYYKIQPASAKETPAKVEEDIQEEIKIAYGGKEDFGQKIFKIEQEITDNALKRRSKLAKELKERGFVDVRGREVKNTQDVAEIVSLFRHPDTEYFQVIFIKNGKVIAHQLLTSGLPTKVAVDPTKFVYKLIKNILKLNPDEVYLCHNHPSGNPTPSGADLGFTGHIFLKMHAICEKLNMSPEKRKAIVNKLKGHIVIDDKKFAFIEEFDYKFYPYTTPKVSFTKGFLPLKDIAKVLPSYVKFTNGKNVMAIFLDPEQRVLGMEYFSPTNLYQAIKTRLYQTKAAQYVIVTNLKELPITKFPSTLGAKLKAVYFYDPNVFDLTLKTHPQGFTQEPFEDVTAFSVHSVEKKIGEDTSADYGLQSAFDLSDEEVANIGKGIGIDKEDMKRFIKNVKNALNQIEMVHTYLFHQKETRPFVNAIADIFQQELIDLTKIQKLAKMCKEEIENPKELAKILVEANRTQKNINELLENAKKAGKINDKDIEVFKQGYEKIRNLITKIITNEVLESKLGVTAKSQGKWFEVEYYLKSGEKRVREVTADALENLQKKYNVKILSEKERVLLRGIDPQTGEKWKKIVVVSNYQEEIPEILKKEDAKIVRSLIPYKNYIPETRLKGSDWVVVYQIDEATGEKKMVFATITPTHKIAEQIKKVLEDKFGKNYEIRISPYSTKIKEIPNFGGMLDIYNFLVQHNIDVSSEEAQRIINAYRSISPFFSHFIHAKDIPGYRIDWDGIIEGIVNLARSAVTRQRVLSLKMLKREAKHIEDDFKYNTLLRYINNLITPLKGNKMLDGLKAYTYFQVLGYSMRKAIQDLTEPLWAFTFALKYVGNKPHILLQPLKPEYQALLKRAKEEGLIKFYLSEERWTPNSLFALDQLTRRSEEFSSAKTFELGLKIAQYKKLPPEEAYKFAFRFMVNEGKPFYIPGNAPIIFQEEWGAGMRRYGMMLLKWFWWFANKFFRGTLKEKFLIMMGIFLLAGFQGFPFGRKILKKLKLVNLKKPLRKFTFMDRLLIGGLLSALAGVDTKFLAPFFAKKPDELLNMFKVLTIWQENIERLKRNLKRKGAVGILESLPAIGRYRKGWEIAEKGLWWGTKKKRLVYKPRTAREKFILRIGLIPFELGETYRRLFKR